MVENESMENLARALAAVVVYLEERGPDFTEDDDLRALEAAMACLNDATAAEREAVAAAFVELGCDARPSTLRALVRRGLLELVRADDGGEPSYRTTAKFLEVFKVSSLAELPSPDEPPK